jgi:ribonuclease HI
MPKKPRLESAQRRITIAFDGACLGNPGPGGYGAILIHEPTGREKIVRGGDPATTNNRMELTAAIEALNALRPGASVTMIGDSQYVLKGVTEWLPGWKARGWRTAQRKPEPRRVSRRRFGLDHAARGTSI